jgi:hypothetical protein
VPDVLTASIRPAARGRGRHLIQFPDLPDYLSDGS